jgi:hypothetical protein
MEHPTYSPEGPRSRDVVLAIAVVAVVATVVVVVGDLDVVVGGDVVVVVAAVSPAHAVARIARTTSMRFIRAWTPRTS